MKRVLFILSVGVACRTETETGLTGVQLTINYDAQKNIDQFAISGVLADTNNLPSQSAAFASGDSPSVPTALTGSIQSLALLLPSTLGGKKVFIRVDGLSAGNLQQTGFSEVPIVRGAMVPLTVALGAVAVCGDGVIRAPIEQCDDGNTRDGDGCDHNCQIESGWACDPFCHECGNGILEASETCDDGNTNAGDGCDSHCQIETKFDCANVPGAATVCVPACGDGIVQFSNFGEQCDDGNNVDGDGCTDCAVDAGWVCPSQGADGQGGDCGKCGNAKRDGTEICDSADVNGQTCLSQGYVANLLSDPSLGLRCAADCRNYDFSSCGPPIDSVANLTAALTSAYTQQVFQKRIVVSVMPDTEDVPQGGCDKCYNVTSSILLDECGVVSCSTPRPFGITLQSMTAETATFRLDPSAGNQSTPVFEVKSPNNVLQALRVTNSAVSMLIDSSATGTNVNHCLFDTPSGGSIDTYIEAKSAAAIEFNRFDNHAAVGNAAMTFADGLTSPAAIGNSISGVYFTAAIGIGAPPSTSSSPVVDQNSIYLFGASTAVALPNGGGSITTENVCMRNNIIAAHSASDATVGINTSLSGVGTCARPVGTTVTVAGGNDVSVKTKCSGPLLNAVCDSSTCLGLCDVKIAPGFAGNVQSSSTSEELCLSPDTNPLIDSAPFLGWDLYEDNPNVLDWFGAGPDYGARESGTSRLYGNEKFSCP